jgi:hypothetical protein
LSLACELAKAHNGNLELVRSDREWTEFRLRLRTEKVEVLRAETALA